VREVIFSVAYRPERLRAVFGDGRPEQRIRYVFEETPLGTGGAVKNAEAELDETTIVFNGDVLTDVSLSDVVERHRSSAAAATLVLARVEDPSAFGLVETDESGRVRSFREKPAPEEVTPETPNTINAGIYVLETATLELMPPGVRHSIERGFFPDLLARGERVAAHVHDGYWIDIGTPQKYLQVHGDILQQRFPVAIRAEPRDGGWVHAEAKVDADAELSGPFYIGPGCQVARGARLGPEVTLVADVKVEREARLAHCVVWPGARLGPQAYVEGAILGQGVSTGRCAYVGPGSVLGEGCHLSDFSRSGQESPK